MLVCENCLHSLNTCTLPCMILVRTLQKHGPNNNFITIKKNQELIYTAYRCVFQAGSFQNIVQRVPDYSPTPTLTLIPPAGRHGTAVSGSDHLAGARPHTHDVKNTCSSCRHRVDVRRLDWGVSGGWRGFCSACVLMTCRYYLGMETKQMSETQKTDTTDLCWGEKNK